MSRKGTILLLLGDPSGIGPELSAKLLSIPELCQQANIFVIAAKKEFLKGQQIAGVHVPFAESADLESSDFSNGLPVLCDIAGSVGGKITEAKATAEGGAYSLASMQTALNMMASGRGDAVCFGPLNKEALFLSGMTENDELHWCAGRLAFDGYVCELNVLEELWTARVTSHIALKDVSRFITKERIIATIKLIHTSLVRSGLKNPRVAIAALNPHAGDGGNFGNEEITVIAPAIELAKTQGIAASGPFPADTIFLKAFSGEFDAVVTMYHDQGQIAMKITGFDRGVTVLGGIPLTIVTPAHGTAYDIVGKGVADVSAMRHAFELACRMAIRRER